MWVRHRGSGAATFTFGAGVNIKPLLCNGSTSSDNSANDINYCFGTTIQNTLVNEFESAADGRNNFLRGTEVITSNEWKFMAVTYDQIMHRIYYEGALDQEVPKTFAPNTANTVSLLIGTAIASGSPSGSTNTDFSIVRIYDRGLSPSEIRQLCVAEVDRFDGATCAADPVPQISLTNSIINLDKNSVTLGRTTDVNVKALDLFGSEMEVGGGNVEVDHGNSGSSQATFSPATDNGDGSYTSTLFATSVGTLTNVTATSNSESIGGGVDTMTVKPMYSTTSLSFDGINDAVDLGDFTVTTGSFSVWFKTTDPSAIFLGKNIGGSVLGETDFRLKSGKLYLDMRNGATMLAITGDIELNDGKWHHAVYAFNPGFIAWVDGVQMTNTRVGSPLNGMDVIGTSVNFGRHSIAALYYEGNLDEAVFFDKILSGAEVIELYNGGVPADPLSTSMSGNVINYWPMGEGGGDFGVNLDDTVGVQNGIYSGEISATFVNDSP